MTNPIDYDQVIMLDAESLAEAGIKDAYDEVLPRLSQFVPMPIEIWEMIDDQASLYSVYAGSVEYQVSGPNLKDSEGQSWGRATHALFAVVNSQLEPTDERFYAVNGGNDLGGVFLTVAQALGARRSLNRRSDWPYIPTLEHPYYGQAY